jgi:leader peptidase (prepilin peptidase)/N-methyltransferase
VSDEGDALLPARLEQQRRSAPARVGAAMSHRRWLLAATFAAAACALSFVRFGAGLDALVGCFFACVLVVLAGIDLERHVLPDRVLLPSAAVLALVLLADDPSSALRRLAWAGGAFAALLVLALAYPAGLGMGDVKLALLLGLALGRSVLAALVLGSIGAGLAGAALLVRYGAAGRRIAMPFGPFLAAAAIAVFLTLGPR